jgi:ubiquinone/menaquinone biosynthesis C-methylase UbiE
VPSSDPPKQYAAKSAYRDYSVAVEYEDARFKSALGRYRYRRERRAVRAMLDQIPDGVSMLDCPCGNGRWWDLLAQKADELIAVDISEGMLRYAGERARRAGIEVQLLEGDAEALPLEDDAVDYTFSFALTRHLPVPVQYRVLREFARVSRGGVISTFGVLTHLTYEIWRRRNLRESYPVLPEELAWIAADGGLEVADRRRSTTPIGTEYVVLLRKRAS